MDKVPPLRSAQGTTLADLRLGQVLSARASQKWKHPWTVTPGWNAKAKRWVATVKAGFVNGQCPIWRTTLTEQKDASRDFGINPLTGKPFFSDPIFSVSQHSTLNSQPVEIPLYLEPAIPLSFRAI